MRVSLSLPEGTAVAIRERVGKGEFSAFLASAAERELRGLIIDEIYADHVERNGPVPDEVVRQVAAEFDALFHGEDDEWHASPAA